MEQFPSLLLRNRILNKLIRAAHQAAPARLFRRYGVPGDVPLQRLGSDYGGWFVPATVGREWIVYSMGVGQDASFDLAMIERHGVTIHAFDPTPHACAFVDERRVRPPILDERFVFSAVGVWDEDRMLRFFAPRTRGWVGSFSALNLQGSTDSIEVPCRSPSTLMRERGHRHIDLLKMDIEGAEYRVIGHLLERAIPVHWLCVEFDQPVPLATTRGAIERLRDRGYLLRQVERWNFAFENVRFSRPGGSGA